MCKKSKTEKIPPIRVTEEEKKKIYKTAKDLGKSVSEYIVEKALLSSKVNIDDAVFRLLEGYNKKFEEAENKTDKNIWAVKIEILKQIIEEINEFEKEK